MPPPSKSAVKPIVSKRAPKAVGNYSAAVTAECNQVLYVSGQIAIEMPKGTVFTGDIKRQAEIVMMNLKNLVQDGGFHMEDIVKCTIYLTDMQNYEAVNEIYGKYFVSRVYPARAVIGVAALPKGVGVEIDAVAVKKVEGKGGGGSSVVVEEIEEKY
jgi:2-iminobutanoate/2-iminopropanoate deaminase